MTTDLAIRLGNTFIGAFTRPPTVVQHTSAAQVPGVWRRLARVVFQAPGRFMAALNRRQAERDALIRYMMSEGKQIGVGRGEIERAVLLTGRADILFPSYFVNAQRR